MKIGDIVVFTKDFTFNGRTYKKGHQFKIFGDSGIRGWDLKDKDGNLILETALIEEYYTSLSEYRNNEINEILK